MDIQTKDGIVLRGIPDGTPDDAIKARIAKIRAESNMPVPAPAIPAESPATESGRKMNSSAQGAINALQGPMLGFADEVYGGLSAAGKSIANLVGAGNGQSFGQNYAEGRDTVRGATDQFRKDYPITGLATSVMAAAPTMLLSPGGAAVSATKAMGSVARSLSAAKAGAILGGASGVGESTATDAQGIVTDAAKGASLSGALGAGGQAVMSGVGAVGGNIAQRVSQSSAADRARLLLSEMIGRDARGIGASNPTAQAQARLLKLGPESTIADAAGANTRQGLDTLATLPGAAKNSVENLIHARQAGRASRLVGAADDALGTGNRGYTATLTALDNARRTQADPFYTQLRGVSVQVDDDLARMLQAAEKAHGGAETLAKLRQEVPIDLSSIKAGDDLAFGALDKVKQSLYDLGQTAKQSGNRELGRAYDDLRIRLTGKMDALSPSDANGSIYRQARNAYSGPSQLSDAVEAGRTAMKTDAIGVAELMRELGDAEREAFRVGALQSIRDKAGTEAGQTSLLKMWKEPSTSGRLREIFGNDYRAFASEVAKEARLKLIESTGRGSQTAARFFGAGEMDASSALGAASSAAALAAGNPGAAPGLVAGTAKAWNQVKTPETTRNELARMLLLRGGDAQAELANLPAFMRNLNANRERQAALAGAISGQNKGQQP